MSMRKYANSFMRYHTPPFQNQSIIFSPLNDPTNITVYTIMLNQKNQTRPFTKRHKNTPPPFYMVINNTQQA